MKALAWIVGAALLALGAVYTPPGCGHDCQSPDRTMAGAHAWVTGGVER